MQKPETDWKAIDAMEDSDVDLSDLPEMSPEDFAKAVVRKGLKPVANKTKVTLRLDTDVQVNSLRYLCYSESRNVSQSTGQYSLSKAKIALKVVIPESAVSDGDHSFCTELES